MERQRERSRFMNLAKVARQLISNHEKVRQSSILSVVTLPQSFIRTLFCSIILYCDCVTGEVNKGECQANLLVICFYSIFSLNREQTTQDFKLKSLEQL